MTESGQFNITRKVEDPVTTHPMRLDTSGVSSLPSSKELEVFGVHWSTVYIGSPRKLNSASREGMQQQKQSR